MLSRCRIVRNLRRDNRGAAAMEFALIGSFVAIAALNMAELAIYSRDRLQVENATAMGAQAAFKTCDLNHLPATTNCPNLSSAVQTAVQSTQLGGRVSLQGGSPSEGYYCVNAAGSLVYVSDVSNRPADCSGVGMAANTPGDYILVQTSFTYAPLFPGITVAAIFGSTITRTAWMRLG